MTSQSAEGRVWLSKQGGTDGPFSFGEIEEMKSKGEFYRYVYIWGTDDKAWRPLHPVPPPPALVEKVAQTQQAQHANEIEKTQDKTKEVKVGGATKAAEKAHEKPAVAADQTAIHSLTAVCHDNRYIIGGVIQKVNPTDGFLSSEDYFATIPPFNKGHWLWINLLDETNGKTENTRAEIVQLSKSKTHWEYQLKWTAAPTIIRPLNK
jgi:hypothetical protein